ncbi:hypothetical protein Golax_016622, partial [Gossypium laxum]|nr:hypothetical protein [Gossypium laxum]
MYQLIVEPLWKYSVDTMSPSHKEFQDCPEQLDLANQAPKSPNPLLSLHALQGFLIVEFEDIFQTPTSLPPPRLYDHRISLIDESNVVKEMLQAGIIRDNNSLFASPVVMVKKKDVVEQTTFDQLKAAICQAPILALQNFQELFCVETDTSGQGVGAAITPYQQKWVAKMLGYDYSILYRKGAQNTMADALSKKPLDLTHQLLQCKCSFDSNWSTVCKRIIASYVTDKKLSQLCQDVQTQPQLHPKYSWHGTFLYRLGKVVV